MAGAAQHSGHPGQLGGRSRGGASSIDMELPRSSDLNPTKCELPILERTDEVHAALDSPAQTRRTTCPQAQHRQLELLRSPSEMPRTRDARRQTLERRTTDPAEKTGQCSSPDNTHGGRPAVHRTTSLSSNTHGLANSQCVHRKWENLSSSSSHSTPVSPQSRMQRRLSGSPSPLSSPWVDPNALEIDVSKVRRHHAITPRADRTSPWTDKVCSPYDKKVLREERRKRLHVLLQEISRPNDEV